MLFIIRSNLVCATILLSALSPAILASPQFWYNDIYYSVHQRMHASDYVFEGEVANIYKISIPIRTYGKTDESKAISNGERFALEIKNVDLQHNNSPGETTRDISSFLYPINPDYYIGEEISYKDISDRYLGSRFYFSCVMMRKITGPEGRKYICLMHRHPLQWRPDPITQENTDTLHKVQSGIIPKYPQCKITIHRTGGRNQEFPPLPNGVTPKGARVLYIKCGDEYVYDYESS